MKGRHAAGGWSPFWRDIMLRDRPGSVTGGDGRLHMVAFLRGRPLYGCRFNYFGRGNHRNLRCHDHEDRAGNRSHDYYPAPATASTAAETTTSTTEAVTTTTTTIPPPLDPAQLVVRVFNANGVPGVAGRMTSRMEEAGYGVAAPDNHAQRLDVSRVWYRDDLSREAAVVREAWIPDALVEAIPLEQEGIDIVVILGRSFEE